jgi:hypothetical protein
MPRKNREPKEQQKGKSEVGMKTNCLLLPDFTLCDAPALSSRAETRDPLLLLPLFSPTLKPNLVPQPRRVFVFAARVVSQFTQPRGLS